jgi:hypothetical protein
MRDRGLVLVSNGVNYLDRVGDRLEFQLVQSLADQSFRRIFRSFVRCASALLDQPRIIRPPI